MKHVLLSFCLATVDVSAPTTPTLLSNVDGAVATRTAIHSTLHCVQLAEIVVLPSDQREVHAVVVDVPQRASLEHASPETWATLPMFDPPYEQTPAATTLQMAMN
jgi:hypothetical protein